MLFTSPLFLFIFLPLVLGVYYLVPFKFKNLILTIFSLFFYAWGEGYFVFILLLLIVLNYLFGLIISRRRYQMLWLLIALLTNLSYIFYFKYLVFTLSIFSFTPPSIIMPLGVSFVTFHLISYVVDVYRKTIIAEKNILNFATYILMFPHLIAGPIVRYQDIGVQIKKRVFSSELFSEGITRFITGLAKKVLIANIMASVADQIFSIFPQYLSSSIIWLGLFSYTLQIYFDFSGYSDMAIGLAKMFGFNFKENFNYPYIATSIQDFWRRWHISLSSWFRDYVYIPLGGNRQGRLRTIFNIAAVFALTGLWHGASWHFIFWGIYYGIFLILENLFLGKLLDRVSPVLRHIYVLVVVIFGWLLFRVSSLSFTLHLLKIMFGLIPNTVAVYHLGYFISKEYLVVLFISLLFVTPLGVNIFQKIKQKLPALEMICLIILFILSIMQLAGDTYNPFIYFRF